MNELAITYDAIDNNHAAKLTQMIMRLFEHWSLTYQEQANLLGLSTKTNTTISRYKKGESHIKFDRDTYDRVRILLSIHQSLRTIFPLNKSLAYAWPKTRNLHFKGKTPVEVIAEEGFLGLVNVQHYLENYKAK